LRIRAGGAYLDGLEAACLDLGALAVTLSDAGDEPVLEPRPGETPTWPDTELTALFAEDIAIDDVSTELFRRYQSWPEFTIQTEQLADRQWEREWLKDFRPEPFGDRLWVCPHGQQANHPNAIVLSLDPGLAFGTGSHPTTALCLRWLDRHIKGGERILDFGCGSGVLAIAALLLGASSADATDIDPQALRASIDNATANQVAEKLNVYAPDSTPADQYDVVLANILASTLIDFAPQLIASTQVGGQLVLSGVLKEQADDVMRAFTHAVEFTPAVIEGDWARLQGTRKALGSL
ncbi:MAG: 50S ribosomal protein L11 methyltransferase, partial [Pseudomonadota bacterium]